MRSRSAWELPLADADFREGFALLSGTNVVRLAMARFYSPTILPHRAAEPKTRKRVDVPSVDGRIVAPVSDEMG